MDSETAAGIIWNQWRNGGGKLSLSIQDTLPFLTFMESSEGKRATTSRLSHLLKMHLDAQPHHGSKPSLLLNGITLRWEVDDEDDGITVIPKFTLNILYRMSPQYPKGEGNDLLFVDTDVTQKFGGLIPLMDFAESVGSKVTLDELLIVALGVMSSGYVYSAVKLTDKLLLRVTELPEARDARLAGLPELKAMVRKRISESPLFSGQRQKRQMVEE